MKGDFEPMREGLLKMSLFKNAIYIFMGRFLKLFEYPMKKVEW